MALKFKLKRPRNPIVPAMILTRKSGAFKDTRKGRGGTQNEQQAYLEEYEESFESEYETCKSCVSKASDRGPTYVVNLARAEHTCPYKAEINDDSTRLCNCCRSCQHECAMDI